MTCHDARELFSALLDDALAADERTRLDAHLATCAECDRELARFRHTVALVQGLSPERAPAGFVERVTAAARPEPWPGQLARRLFVPWTMKLPLEAAALLLVGGLAVLVFRGSQEQQGAARLDDSRARLEQPAPAPEVARRAPRSSAVPAYEEPSGQQDTPTRQPERTEEQAAPKAQVSPAVPEARAPLTAPTPAQAPAPRAQASPQSAAPSGDVAADVGKRQPEPLAKRDAAPFAESDRREKAGPAEAPASKEAPAGKLADRAVRESRARENAARDSSQGRLEAMTRSAAVADVRGTLVVADAQAVAAKIDGIVGGLGGAVAGRRDAGPSMLVELSVPRDRYPELIRELTRLGQWQPEAEPPALPPTVRVAIRLAR